MFEIDQFKEEVICAYHEKMERRMLADELVRPTPARLMRYCIAVVSVHATTDDISMLNRIFNPQNNHPDLKTAIERFGAAKFKPLRNFLVGKTINPDENVVKLLAVLIDFQPRPFDKWREARSGRQSEDQEHTETEESNSEESGQNAGEETNPQRQNEEGGERHTNKPPKEIWTALKMPAICGLVAASAVIGTSQIWRPLHQCMYWTGDSYKPISCKETREDAVIIAQDKQLVDNFKKITRPDTLSYEDIGRVWYAKIDRDSIEFYTDPGKHPIYTDKFLKPVTEYIINKYVK